MLVWSFNFLKYIFSPVQLHVGSVKLSNYDFKKKNYYTFSRFKSLQVDFYSYTGMN
ncbi:hypothetical protein LDENG_00227980 [Lucifuga dentata]|nr:hypothetical protein LDENG_00227980 [Lucifuga dentata]